MPHTCLRCGKPITWQFAICSKCEETYGRRSRQWPKWLRFLWNDIQRERRQNKRINTNETRLLETDSSDDTLDLD